MQGPQNVKLITACKSDITKQPTSSFLSFIPPKYFPRAVSWPPGDVDPAAIPQREGQTVSLSQSVRRGTM